MPGVARLPDGRVDPDCPLAVALGEAIREANGAAPSQWDAAISELLPWLAEARWAEAFIPLAWGDVLDLKPFAPFHYEAWAWWASIDDERPPAFVGCWFRGAGKSSTFGMMLGLSALIGLRDYALWVGAREQAIIDKVSSVGALLAVPRVRAAFPDQTELYRDAMTGVKQDWRRGRVATASGFALDAVGMDQALRGALRLNRRPGLLLIDDIETSADSEYILARKFDQLSRSVVEAGADHCATAFIENLISETSIMNGTLTGRLDFLRRRVVSGPWPQIDGLETELEDTPEGPQYSIVGGEPNWEGADLVVSERQMNEAGLTSFLLERQHQTDAVDGVMLPRSSARYVTDPPGGLLVCRAWDLAATEGGGDFTAGALLGWSADEGALYILDMARGQWGADVVERNVLDLAEADRGELGRYKVVLEDQPGAAGKAWKLHWERDVLAGFVAEFRPPQGSKVWRADALSALWRKGRVFLVEGDWNQPLVAEFALFGTDLARHDDQVDAVSLGFNFLTGRARSSKGSTASAAGLTIGR